MNTDAKTLLEQAVARQASDIFIIAGLPVSFRRQNQILKENEEKMLPPDTEQLLKEIYELADHRDIHRLYETGDDDFAFALPGVSRLPCQRLQAARRPVCRDPRYHLSSAGSERTGHPGLCHVPGRRAKGYGAGDRPAGSGKSTTLACIIDRINQTREDHIITLEDPLEFLHRHGRSIVSQREINVDTESYVTALRAALRQSPDVILLGEMRDYETINIAMTAAETGHLLFSTLHTIGAANTIDRIIDVFPANQQHQIAVQLSLVLTAVISQQLVPGVDGRMLPAFEIMTVTPAIRNMIRDSKIPQIEGVINSSAKEDMISMDASLLSLFKKGQITKETALTYATNPEMLGRKLI